MGMAEKLAEEIGRRNDDIPAAPIPSDDARELVERIREGLCTEFKPEMSDDEATAEIERYVEVRLAAERERVESLSKDKASDRYKRGNR